MNNTMKAVRQLLTDGGYSIGALDAIAGSVAIFENDTVLGFVLTYPDADALIEEWRTATARILDTAQFALRQAGPKAWNTYLVLLADAPSDYGQRIILENIEENLVGTRKIARAGVENTNDLRHALMPLLAVQNAPRLEAVDMVAEIRLRTTDLPAELVEGFLSNAPESVLLQILETGQ